MSSPTEPAETICQIAISRDSAGFYGCDLLIYANGFDRRTIPVEFATIDALCNRIRHEIREVFEQRKAEKAARDRAIGEVP